MLLVLSIGCAPPGDTRIDDTAMADSSVSARDTDRADSPVAATTDTLRQVPRTGPDTLSRPVRPPLTPTPPRTARDTSGRVRVLHGRAELRLDSTTFLPADYVRVRLRTASGSFETWTNRNGEFSFENVPVTGVELIFLAPEKVDRVVYRQPVALTAGDNVRLAVVHIPIDSIKRPRPDE